MRSHSLRSVWHILPSLIPIGPSNKHNSQCFRILDACLAQKYISLRVNPTFRTSCSTAFANIFGVRSLIDILPLLGFLANDNKLYLPIMSKWSNMKVRRTLVLNVCSERSESLWRMIHQQVLPQVEARRFYVIRHLPLGCICLTDGSS
jgi:hypothetical protein